MKALIISYLPGGEKSNTRKLLDAAIGALKAKKIQVETLDLTGDQPDLFNSERIAVYYERNYGGQKVPADRSALMAGMDRMTAQLKGADFLIVATPMYNFSLPAAVKGWFDAVMQKGETWTFGAPGVYVGLMKGRKALFLSSSGGLYSAGNPMEHCESLAKVLLGFMGFEVEVVTAGGMNQFMDKAPAVIAQAQEKVRGIIGKWF